MSSASAASSLGAALPTPVLGGPRTVAELERLLAERTAELEAVRAAQRESQTFFARSFHASPVLMSIASATDYKLLEVNPAWLSGSGYTRDEVIGRSTLELGLWVKSAQREDFLARIQRDHAVRDFEAEFRNKQGVLRTLLLNADLIELGARPCVLTVAIDVSERRRRTLTQNATYEISQAVLSGVDLPTLLARVHKIIGELMPARNFYVALLNTDRSLLSFPYFVDETMPHPEPRAPRNGITEFVIDTGEPLLALDRDVVATLRTRGDYVPTGHPCAQWMGAPLKVDGRAIGVIALQDYHNPAAYTEEDKRLLMFVADQTAAAVHRQQAEAAQREARTYFEKSFHTSPALMVITRLSDRRIVEANPAFLRACGYARDEVIGRTADELDLWVRPEQRTAYFAQLRERGAIRNLEGDFRVKSGEVTHFIIHADTLELGGTPSLLTVGIDITDRRRREKRQAATYAISQAVLAGGDLPTLFAELHRIVGELIPAKNFYVALLNPERTLLSFPYFVDETTTTPAPRKPGYGLTEYVMHTGKPLRTTADELTVILRGDSRYKPTGKPSALWLGAPLMIDGRAIGVITVQDYHDATAYTDADLQLLNFVAEQAAATVYRRQSEAALARAEKRYRSIFENAVEGLYITSPEGRFISANPALAQMLGYASPAEMLTAVNDVGRQIYVRRERRQEFFALIKTRDEISDFESEVYRRDGGTCWISESVRVVRNSQGEIDHFEGVAIDITAQREAARALRAAKEAADAASRAKSYFLASVSHELRTPLNGILGYTQILQRDTTLGPKQRDGVRVIHESADHLLALINDVLDLSKIEAGRIELHPADFNLPEFALGVERVFSPRAREKSILFETAVASDLPAWVRGDEQRLRQIVFNLLSNAVKFTKAGGVVFSVQQVARSSEISNLKSEIPTAAVRFSVSDTGPGIAADDLAKLFEPFTQVGNKASAAATGTGLGLAISRSLVERMGGKLNVESKPGWGSRFWFDVTLPIAAGATNTNATLTRRIVGYLGDRRRVLVVDDNAANRAVMVDMLAPLGFEIVESADGTSALEHAAAFRPHLVLMDLRLPNGIDGLEATRRLRASDLGTAVRIIAVSASAYDFDRQECFTAGCDEFLAKPFREEQLWSAVERTLNLTWTYAEAEETRAPFAFELQAPPAAEATALYELAAKGDVVAIRQRAQALIALDPKYTPFAQSVLDLAARFKMKAIRQFVARYTQ